MAAAAATAPSASPQLSAATWAQPGRPPPSRVRGGKGEGGRGAGDAEVRNGGGGRGRDRGGAGRPPGRGRAGTSVGVSCFPPRLPAGGPVRGDGGKGGKGMSVRAQPATGGSRSPHAGET